MTYSLRILRRARKELARLPEGVYLQVRDSIRGPANEPRPQGCHRLTAREGWRIRVGNYRVIYDIDDKNKTVIVLHVGHRRDVYR
ncbi:MAG: type II toxin-antitoxin system RelE/ParE family toxin [Dehalococcoidia bacterium]|nr:type II toxin-antitoxin system RelE/ParE family toxin [Dehalococcoidia bacterium]